MHLIDFIHRTHYDDLPVSVRTQLNKAVLDLFTAMLAGADTPASRTMADYAATILSGEGATVINRGRICNAAGAALANGCAANALDIDDGFRPAKGHPGAVVIPAVLAQAEALQATGRDFLTAVAIGYEIGMRAGVIWHTHPHRGPSYHGSGSWGSTGAAAACAYLLRLNPQQTAMALGIAEYHAPLAPIMSCVEQPGMVKDGLHWGAFVGVTAAQLAARSFTGIPSVLIEPAYETCMASLGRDWWIERLYFKFFPCCRWSQPAVAGALALRQAHALTSEQIAAVKIDTFQAATHLHTRQPANTEEAQYSLAYPVACALVHGRFGIAEVSKDNLNDPQVLDLTDCVEMTVDPDLEDRFPARALARVTIETTDGQTHSIGPLPAPGDADTTVTWEDLKQKSQNLLSPRIGSARVAGLIDRVEQCADLPTIQPLVDHLKDSPP